MKLSTARKTLNVKKGFTLIELLVVIGILGILAAALVATINPLEQLNKANDSTRQQLSTELVGAFNRYYASQGRLPWETGGPAACVALATANDMATRTVDTMDTECIQELIATDELKDSILTSNELVNLFITEPRSGGQDGSVAICYLPSSKAETNSAETIYTNAGATGTCTAGTNCHQCAF
jgi:prepilin-type N-terminal cleavage/methylation domain-containing protein